MKIRFAYQKLGKVRFLGHLDMARLWERALRKARLPVAMSAGFTPRPKVSFGLALPTGAESLVELLDVTFDESGGRTVDVAGLTTALTEALPSGIDVIDADPVAPSAWSLQEDVTATTWVMAVDSSLVDVDERVATVLAAPDLWVERERKGERRRDDLRPGIVDLRSVVPDGLPTPWITGLAESLQPLRFVEATLTTSGRGVRPTEMAEVLRPGEDPWITMPRVIRTHQWIGRDDAPRVSARAGKDTSHERRPEHELGPREHERSGPDGRDLGSRQHEPA